MTSALIDEDDYEEDFTGRVRRNAQGRPYILANPDWEKLDNDWTEAFSRGFSLKPAEPRGPSKLYTRTTTYVSCLEDTYNLGQHLERGVAVGMARKPSLVARANNVDLDGPERDVKRTLNQICEEAKDVAGWGEKAALGTAFHDLAEIADEDRFTADMTVRLTPEMLGMLKAYLKETKDFEYAHIEQGVVNDDLGYYGTPDRLRWVEYRNKEYLGNGVSEEYGSPKRRLRVCDIKTGRIDYGQQKMALQMAAYAIAKLYDPDTGIRTELDIDQEWAEIIHVPYGEGTCTIYPIYLPPAIEALTNLVPAVRAFRSRTQWFEAPAAGNDVRSGLAASWPKEAPEAL